MLVINSFLSDSISAKIFNPWIMNIAIRSWLRLSACLDWFFTPPPQPFRLSSFSQSSPLHTSFAFISRGKHSLQAICNSFIIVTLSKHLELSKILEVRVLFLRSSKYLKHFLQCNLSKSVTQKMTNNKKLFY